MRETEAEAAGARTRYIESVICMKWINHLRTINKHRRLVRKACFKLGLYKQGLLHDVSKYSPVEFLAGAKYFDGSRSPNELERMDRGYSAAWLHHKGRNKHHLEYWIDYSPELNFHMGGMEMPLKYVAEMFCDRVAASKTYLGEAYTDSAPLEYFEHSRKHYIINANTEALLEKLLLKLRDEGEAATLDYLKDCVLK